MCWHAANGLCQFSFRSKDIKEATELKYVGPRYVQLRSVTAPGIFSTVSTWQELESWSRHIRISCCLIQEHRGLWLCSAIFVGTTEPGILLHQLHHWPRRTTCWGIRTLCWFPLQNMRQTLSSRSWMCISGDLDILPLWISQEKVVPLSAQKDSDLYWDVAQDRLRWGELWLACGWQWISMDFLLWSFPEPIGLRGFKQVKSSRASNAGTTQQERSAIAGSNWRCEQAAAGTGFGCNLSWLLEFVLIDRYIYIYVYIVFLLDAFLLSWMILQCFLAFPCISKLGSVCI